MAATTYTAIITHDGETATEVTVSTKAHPNVTSDTATGTGYAAWITEHADRYRRHIQDVLDVHQDPEEDTGDAWLDATTVTAAEGGDPEASQKVSDWVDRTGFADYHGLDAYVTEHTPEPMTRDDLVEALAEYLTSRPGEDTAALLEEAASKAAESLKALGANAAAAALNPQVPVSL